VLIKSVGAEEQADNRPLAVRIDPNPFRHATWISVGMRAEGLGLRIYDATGRLVNSFDLPSSLSPNSYALKWNGTDQGGVPLPAGIYILKGVAGGQEFLQKIVKLR
jgi:hypothetical protein